MKKIIAALLALTLVMSASVTAFGAIKSEVMKVQKDAAEYIVSQFSESGFTVNDAKYFEHAVKGGADVSAYKDGFVASTATIFESEPASLDIFVQSVSALEALGEYPESGSHMAAQALIEHNNFPVNSPYSYIQAIKLSKDFGLDDTAKEYADALCAYYTMGTGPVFWGSADWMSGDDVASFILALAPVKDDYQDYIEDACAILENYYSAAGYINTYTGANTDTTGLALAAYAAIGDKDKADEIYDMLLNNFFDETTGSFTADYDALYATGDALTGIEEYLPLADSEPEPENNTPAPAPVQPAEENKNAEEKKSPNTGNGTVYAAISCAAVSAGLILALKKKEEV